MRLLCGLCWADLQTSPLSIMRGDVVRCAKCKAVAGPSIRQVTPYEAKTVEYRQSGVPAQLWPDMRQSEA